MIYFTIKLTETCDSIFFSYIGTKNCKDNAKNKTREQRTIFFKLKRNVKINNEAAKRV